MKIRILRIAVLSAALVTGGCAVWGVHAERGRPAPAGAGARSQDEAAFAQWRDGFLKKFKPLSKASALAWWTSSITGKDEDFKKRMDLEMQMNRLYADRKAFAQLKAWRAAGTVQNPLLHRQLDILYLNHLGYQVDTKLLDRMTELGSQIDQLFNTFRGEVNGRKVTENEIRLMLRTSTSNAEVEAAWKAYQAVGKRIEPKLRELVTLRNQSARAAGYANYHALQLAIQEFDGAELLQLFDQLGADTAGIFKTLKAEVDAAMAKRFGVPIADLRPWNYQDLFFQEAPQIYPVNLNQLYQGRNIAELGRKFYDSLGLNVDDILARSDLYEKPGKSPHAFCTDIDREGDIRTLQNLMSNELWMGTLLHELGHGVYSKYTDRRLPYLLRDAAHIFATEGVAMFFGRQAKDAAWLSDNLGVPPAAVAPLAAAAQQALKLEQIIFSRWTQVMLRFEKAMYENPGQDLNKLWWELKAKYQLLTPDPQRNEPDYAAKIHIVSAPVYYHNYMLGELFASQMYAKLRAERHLKPGDLLHLTGDRGVGTYFQQQVFAPGLTLGWRKYVEAATGQPLSAKAFADQFMAR
ncbi:MAG: M2 family metallopeptidase [Kiritimatiellaeota bacterium]|nr:M2 family metallopeptidase [Kiritimatiellota bacterium]